MEDKDSGLMENQLRLVMIDRMLKEKYNEISYLAIQPPKDPQIVEINKKDLDWLLEEQARCAQAEMRVRELQKQQEDLQAKYEEILHSRAWRWGLRFSKAVHVLTSPIHKLCPKSDT